jgi:hypothetical protein
MVELRGFEPPDPLDANSSHNGRYRSLSLVGGRIPARLGGDGRSGCCTRCCTEPTPRALGASTLITQQRY